MHLQYLSAILWILNKFWFIADHKMPPKQDRNSFFLEIIEQTRANGLLIVLVDPNYFLVFEPELSAYSVMIDET